MLTDERIGSLAGSRVPPRWPSRWPRSGSSGLPGPARRGAGDELTRPSPTPPQRRASGENERYCRRALPGRWALEVSNQGFQTARVSRGKIGTGSSRVACPAGADDARYRAIVEILPPDLPTAAGQPRGK